MATSKNHPGNIEERAGTFRVRLSVAGKRHKFTLNEGTTREDAEAFARKKDDELRSRGGRGLPGPMGVSELLDRYTDVRLPERAPGPRRRTR